MYIHVDFAIDLLFLGIVVFLMGLFVPNEACQSSLATQPAECQQGQIPKWPVIFHSFFPSLTTALFLAALAFLHILNPINLQPLS